MITTCLWYQGNIEAALERYGSLFEDFEVLSLDQMGPVTLASWRMHGTEFRGISQPSDFRLNEAASLSVTCADQAEVDRLWFGLIADGGEESMCGWLRDPFGLSWQIIPARLTELLSDPNPSRAAAATQVMLTQKRIVVADLEAAANAIG